MTVTALVLAGGKSSRMGRDKASLPLGDETMLARVVRLAGEVAGEVLVVGRRDQDGVTVPDAVEDQGPLSGIATGLSASRTDLNLVIACDMPLILPAVLRRMLDAIGDHDACVAVVDGHASALCGVYRKRVAPDAQALLDAGERRVMRLLDRVQTKRVDAAAFRDIDPELRSFISIDTPERYAELIKTSRPQDLKTSRPPRK